MSAMDAVRWANEGGTRPTLEQLKVRARDLQSQAYAAEADVHEIEGDLERAAWKRALARGDWDEAHRYHIRSQAREHLAGRPCDPGLGADGWAEVLRLCEDAAFLAEAAAERAAKGAP